MNLKKNLAKMLDKRNEDLEREREREEGAPMTRRCIVTEEGRRKRRKKVYLFGHKSYQSLLK